MKRFKKILVKDFKILPKKKKQKTRIWSKGEKQGYLSKGKIFMKCKKVKICHKHLK